MSRRSSREKAFIFLFEMSFGVSTPEEILENSKYIYSDEADENVEVEDFTRETFDGVVNNKESIDKIIADNLNNWSINRISKVALSILRLAVYEIMFAKEVPNSVVADEAVKLAKKYSTIKEATYINGVLGSVIDKAQKNFYDNANM